MITATPQELVDAAYAVGLIGGAVFGIHIGIGLWRWMKEALGEDEGATY